MNTQLIYIFVPVYYILREIKMFFIVIVIVTGEIENCL